MLELSTMKLKLAFSLVFLSLLMFLVCCKPIQKNAPYFPTITTNPVNEITEHSAKSGGTVISNSQLASIPQFGICWSTGPNPSWKECHTIDGKGSGSFTSQLSLFTTNTVYYVRAYAWVIPTACYGNVQVFKTTGNVVDTVTDIEGNVYHIITIGTQKWMLENLRSRRYRNGDPLTEITNIADWNNIKVGAYCTLDNDNNNAFTFGRYYNLAVIQDSRSIAPIGWHIPSDQDWKTLSIILVGDTLAGGKLKENSTMFWNSPNYGATNSSGFTGLPAGFPLAEKKMFWDFGRTANWWGKTSDTSIHVCYSLTYDNGMIYKGIFPGNGWGYNIRCIKD